eukprot:25803_1
MSSCHNRNCSVYNESDAFIPLYFSYASYCDASNINNWDCVWCHKASDDFKVENVFTIDYLQGFIGYDLNENRIVITFRGTHNYEDWVKDLEYKQIPYPNVENGYVHEGFYNAYSEIQSAGLILSLQSLLSNHSNTNNILITGHSMGGALAELCALDLIHNKAISSDISIDLYTFGCPRWANKALAHYFNHLDNIETNWRIVNANDPVAIVPGQSLGTYGFHHTATQVLYSSVNNDLQFMVCDGSGEDRNCGYSLWSEQSNRHVWYLGVYEDCAMDDGNRNVAQPPLEYGMQMNAVANANPNDTHWKLSLLLIGIGFVVAAIYYVSIKLYYRYRGYERIGQNLQMETDSETPNTKKQERNMMNTSLLHDVVKSQN